MEYTYETKQTLPILIDTTQAANLLGCSPRTIARMCERGMLKACRAGNRWRVNRNALMTYIGETE